MAVPDPVTFWKASDKIAIHRLADVIGVPTPTARYVDDSAAAGSLDDVSLPCVVKPARSRLRTPDGWVIERLSP